MRNGLDNDKLRQAPQDPTTPDPTAAASDTTARAEPPPEVSPMTSLPRLLLLLFLAATTTGCATLGTLPSAQFSGMTVKTVQTKPGSDKMALNLGLNFKVKNPLDIKLVIPKHTFGLTVDGAPATESGVKKEFSVGKKSAKTIKYDFTLDLSKNGLGRAFGKNATFGFQADADIDVPAKVIEILNDQLPGLGDVGGENLTQGLSALGKQASGGMGKAKLTFEHQGKLKLAKIPKIKARGHGQPTVALTGQSETMNLSNLLGDLTDDIAPLAAFFEQFENARVNQQVELPVGELLEAIGIPSNLTSAALTAINGVLQLNNKPRVGSANNTVTLPVQMPKLPQLLASLDPQAARKIDDFTAGWARFESNSGALASMALPTALPEGMRVSLPFAIDNPNEFSIIAPSFRIGLVDGSGKPVAMVQVQKPGSNKALTSLEDRRVKINGQSVEPMELVSEFHWDRLGASLLQMAANPDARPDMSGFKIVGDVTIDPGYGPITLPIRVPVPAPPGGGSSSDGASGGNRRSSGSSSSGSSGGGSKSGSTSSGSSPSRRSSGSSNTSSSKKDEEEEKKRGGSSTRGGGQKKK